MHTAGFDVPISLNDLGGPAMRAFTEIADAWKLTDAERKLLLGLSSDRAYEDLASGLGPAMDADILHRISHVLGIYGALHVHFPQVARAQAWLRTSNAAPIFAGRTALEKMTSGRLADLQIVRQYLEAECS